MSEPYLKGQWNQLKGKVKEEWGELTDDELDQIDGQRHQLVGLLQEKYGYTRAKAELEFDRFVKSLEEKTS
ncbi:MAG: CsbD family protein [Candidatus Promineifilaceae bacterium]|nr:CsbD family protein [Candidatus Promineifilaceae bacterium]